MRSWRPIRRSLFGTLGGVPSTARRGWASSRSLEGKRSAQRHPARRRQRWKPKGRDAIGGLMRSTTAWPGIAGDARWTSMLVHKDSWNRKCVVAKTHENVEPFLRTSVKQQNRQSVEAALCSSTNTEVRFHAIPYSANQRFSA